MAVFPAQEPAKLRRVLIRIVHAADHAVFIGHAPTCALKIMITCLHDRIQMIFLCYGHQLLPLGIGGAVQGQRQCDLQFLPGQIVDPRHDPTGGYRHITLAHVHPLLMAEDPDKPQELVVIIQRLSGPHDHHVGHRLSHGTPHRIDLFQHLPGREPPDQPADRGRAETAAHPAPGLGGDTHGIPVAVMHPHTLHHLPVREGEQEFPGPVQSGHLGVHRV